ncbi:MAG TPA: tetratricopeptide repeat protein [Opitutaceae bacterium]|nr:tetratricopeptide repeat protein [Opitutaceae bacterium]
MHLPRLLPGLLIFAIIFGFLAAEEKPGAGPALPATPLTEAIGLFQARKMPEAQAAFAKIAAAEPTNAEAAQYLGLLALMRNDSEQAVQWLEKAAQLAPTNSYYCRLLGDAYGQSAGKAGVFSRFGFAKKCLASYNKAIELDPNNLDARSGRIEYYRRAPAIIGGGMDKAYAEAAEIRRRDPSRGAAVLGNLYIAEKKYAEAFALLDELIAKDSADKALLYQVGRLAAISGQQLERGEASLKEYFHYEPTPNEPPLYNAHWRLGTLYERKGDKAAARAEYQTALQLRPDYTTAQNALKQLQ